MARSTAIRVPAALAVIALAAAIWPGPAARAGDRRVVVQGRVLAESGDGMAGWPVQLIATQRYVELGSRSSGGGVATLARTTADASGYFSFDLPKERGYQFWFLRFVDPQHLDPIRYLPPPDIEVTDDVRRHRVAAVQVTIRVHPDWAEVQRRIAEAGGESTPRGKILRVIGLPEKSVRDEISGEEEWWYFTKGVVYTFRGPEPTGTRRFEPVAPPPVGRAGSGTSGEAG